MYLNPICPCIACAKWKNCAMIGTEYNDIVLYRMRNIVLFGNDCFEKEEKDNDARSTD